MTLSEELSTDTGSAILFCGGLLLLVTPILFICIAASLKMRTKVKVEYAFYPFCIAFFLIAALIPILVGTIGGHPEIAPIGAIPAFMCAFTIWSAVLEIKSNKDSRSYRS